MPEHRLFPAYGGLLWLLLIIAAVLYWPGLDGYYILDDQPNLESLANIGHPPEDFVQPQVFNEVGRFISEGIASSLGRPISLTSFALQAHRWPDGVWHFKYVNLMIHLLNGALVFWFIWLVTRLLRLETQQGLLLALLTTTLWLLNPLQVSTASYIIQRMAQLSALFTLGGLVAYLYGRLWLTENKLFKGYLLASLGIGLGGLLATFSKETGALLVLYVLVLEATLLYKLSQPAYWRIWRGLFIYLPSLLLAGYLIYSLPGFIRGYEIRDFTLVERLWSEARILVDYLGKILWPRLHTLNLFHDDFLISTGWLSPPTTLLSVIVVVGVFFAALFLRRRYPVFAFAALWFFAGHLLESTFLPLVLYFEHRNYFPMLGPLFALAYAVIYVFRYLQNPLLRNLTAGLVALWIGLIMFATWNETRLWGQPLVQAHVWAEQKPLSRYAQSHAASLLISAGRPEEALDYYRHMLKVFPDDGGPHAFWLAASCFYPEIPRPDIQAALENFGRVRGEEALINGLKVFLEYYHEGQCPAYYDTETVENLLRALVYNPNLHRKFRHSAYNLYGLFLARQERYREAIDMADQSLALKQEIAMKMQRLVWLIGKGDIAEALSYIKRIRAELSPLQQQWYAEDLDRLENNLQTLLET